MTDSQDGQALPAHDLAVVVSPQASGSAPYTRRNDITHAIRATPPPEPMTDRVTDPRPIPTPSVAGLVIAVAVPLIYLLWVFVLIPIARSGATDPATEAMSLDVLRVITQAAAPLAMLLGAVGVAMVRRDPHLYRWQWVGVAAIAVGITEIVAYAGGWLGLWPTW